MAFLTKVQPNATISLALDAARSDGAQGALTILGEAVANWKANSITFISLGGGALQFRLNDDDAGLITASDGLKVEGIPFTEIYWTHAAQAGITAEIFVAWVD